MGQASPLKKKGTWKKYGETEWKSRMRMSVEENWMKREERYRKSDERSRDCPLLQRKCRITSYDLMRELQKVLKRSQKIQSIQDKRKNTERKLGGKRRNAEHQRIIWVEGRALHSAGG